MKKITKLSLVCITALSLNINAVETQGLYAGVGVAKTTLSGTGYKYDEVNLKVMIGEKITDNIAVEAQFTNFKDGEVVNLGGGNTANSKGKSFGVQGFIILTTQQ